MSQIAIKNNAHCKKNKKIKKNKINCIIQHCNIDFGDPIEFERSNIGIFVRGHYDICIIQHCNIDIGDPIVFE